MSHTRRSVLGGIGASALALSGTRSLAGDLPSRGPVEFREIENSWIPMRDGVRLAARIWLPVDADQHPVPALFNYCPYFARLFTRSGDDARFPFFASRGYACVRVDIRGSGNSDGKPQDEYVKQEQDDALEIIAWIAKQPWCTGKVGMEGLSWSGFNCLQIAARRPPALKAILSHCSSDDRYADDAHFKGGTIIHDMFNWGTVFFAFQGQAPDPAIVGADGWRERWLARLNAVDFNLGNWLTHQHRDAFWKHASVREDYSRIQCPVYAVGGWVDGYKNTVFRLLAGLKVPRKGLVGPWTHIYPHNGVPGPAIGYLDEALRWWDHWLKGVDTGIMKEPMVRAWMQNMPAKPDVPDVPGRWVAEDNWPSPRITEQVLFFTGSRGLAAAASKDTQLDLQPLQTVGANSGNWCPSGAGASEDMAIELALDQRPDDARSLVFDSEPLPEALEILGAGSIELNLAVDKPVAYVAVRLNMVSPDGESNRVTYGILNLCQRESSETPTALEPGRRYTVRVPLDNAAHRFAAGSRIRVSISTTYWPMMLPSPEAVRLSVFTGLSKVTLPVRPPRAEDAQLHAFGPAFVPPVAIKGISGEQGTRKVEWDVGKKEQVIHHNVGNGVALLETINTRLVGDSRMECWIKDDSPEGASISYKYVMGWERDEWRPRTVATSKTVASRTEISIQGELKAYNGDELVFSRSWNRKVPRNLV